MKRLLFFLLLAASPAGLKADAPAPDLAPTGIIVLNAVAGYDAAASAFASIQWTGRESGCVIDKAGNKLPFLNEAIGRIIYFDQAYYEEVDHNQFWVDERASVRGREVVLAPVNAVELSTDDSNQLASEQAVLEDTSQRFAAGQALLAPFIAKLKDERAQLANGMVLQNGNWIAAKDAVTQSTAVQVVGDSEVPVTFTTKDGRRFVNAHVTVTDTGVSVLTDDGGGAVSFDDLPADLSGFPKTARDKINDWKSKNQPVETPETEAEAPAAPTPASPTGFFAKLKHFVHAVINKTWSYFSPGSSSSSPASSPTAAAPTHSPAPAAPAPAPSPAPAQAQVPPSPSPTTPAAQPDLANCVVLIKGDYSEGTGFLTRTASGPVVITNLHVVAGNTTLKILTASGEEITPLSLQGAADRDLAMFAIQDKNYSYLTLATDVDRTTQVGDDTIIPGNSEGGEVTLKTDGNVVGIGPERIEFSNPIFHGNSGGPVLDVKTNKVVAVATGAIEMKPSDDLDKDSYANANSAIKGPMRYFGLRLDTVPSWEPYDQNGFVQETLFLKKFHEENRALDSYLNGAKSQAAYATNEDGPLDARYFLTNDKIRKADEDWRSAGGRPDNIVGLQELVWNLESVANADLNSVQNPDTFYGFDQPSAKHELAYRKALIGEIQNIQSEVDKGGVSASGVGGL